MHQSNQQFQQLLHQQAVEEQLLLGPLDAEKGNKPEPIKHLCDKEITEERLASYRLELQFEVREHQ
jgi:hypothetical protein